MTFKVWTWQPLVLIFAAVVALVCGATCTGDGDSGSSDDDSASDDDLAADDDNDDNAPNGDDDSDSGDDDELTCDDNGDGTVTCSDGLTWTQQDNGEYVTQLEAIAWARNLDLGSHDDWRLPTLDELFGLYDIHKLSKASCDLRPQWDTVHIRPPFTLTCWGNIWSGDANGDTSYAWLFSFREGFGSTVQEATNAARVLAVR